MGILKSFDIKRLRPFRKGGNRLPPTTPEEEEKITKLDHDLQPDEQAYVRHYVNYADVLLTSGEEQTAPGTKSGENLVEMPRKDEGKSSSHGRDNNKAA
jgi:hypothetical protein